MAARAHSRAPKLGVPRERLCACAHACAVCAGASSERSEARLCAGPTNVARMLRAACLRLSLYHRVRGHASRGQRIWHRCTSAGTRA
eukprot:7566506-Alexandrium_andersonii.AAC.1